MHHLRQPPSLHAGAVVAWLALAACATPFGNVPENPPITPEFVARSAVLRGGSAHVIALALSGGGMRAAAFAFGALQALAHAPEGAGLFDANRPQRWTPRCRPRC